MDITKLENLNTGEVLRFPFHILIAGCTRSGKSVLLHKIIAEEMARGSALILCDPKRVEFAKYRKYKTVIDYANTPETIESALKFAIREMERRYRKMTRKGETKSSDFQITIIIDEFADLIMTQKKTFEPLIIKLAQLSMASNIKMIIATQTPNRRTITANIQANFVCKIGLHADSPIESRQIVGDASCCALPMPQSVGVGVCALKLPGESVKIYKIERS